MKLADDPYLAPYLPVLDRRAEHARRAAARLTGGTQSLADFASGHEYFGLHRTPDGWVFREWAPNATHIVLTGSFNNWQEPDTYALQRLPGDNGGRGVGRGRLRPSPWEADQDDLA